MDLSCSNFVPYQNNMGGMGNAGNHVSSTHMPNNTYNTFIILTTVFIIQIKTSTKNNDKNRKTEITMNTQRSKKKVD
jgi:hypothetical protein